MATPTAIVAYLLLFSGVAVIFLFVNLWVGKFLRPAAPNEEKLEIYECGEPTIGSSFVQFDLRFYVVALLFLIFDVEVAFFFPWATVFGKATQLASPQMQVLAADVDPAASSPLSLSQAAAQRYRELGVERPALSSVGDDAGDEAAAAAARQAVRENARQIARASLWDIGVFFAVLMVGFAYVWRRGDLDWVRSMQSRSTSLRRQEALAVRPVAGRPAGSILSA